MTVADYLDIAAQKREARDKAFIGEWLIPDDALPQKDVKDVLTWAINSGYLAKREVAITESTLDELSEKIKNREWTAYEVAMAFCHRASIAHQLVNCLSEVFFKEGLQQARELDEYYEKTNQLKGPFHGLPISLKDNFNVKGQATTIGFVGFSFNPEKFESESLLVSKLRELGAVFCFKTNVPVAMMMPESTNHIYGNTVNPFNRATTSGGSSGGECALGALLGRCYLGLGSDIGGSLRIPASLQNLFTLRPSSGRFTTYGARSGLPGLESVASVNGPISTTMENLEFYCKNIVNHGEQWLVDSKCLEIPWREVILPEKLTVALLKDDGIVKPYPAIARALDQVEHSLKLQGHEVIGWNPLHHDRLTKLIGAFFLSDGGKHCKEYLNLTGEPVFDYMKPYESASDLPVSELWDLQTERTRLCNEYLAQWNKTCERTSSGKPIDAIITPVSPYSGVGIDKFRYIGYTAVFNALDWAAGTIPVTRVDKRIDKKDEMYEPRNMMDARTYDEYDADEVDGCAASVQIVCKRLQEEKVVKMMKTVSRIVGTHDYWSSSK
ncbi:LADA_0H20252g1_1 [Lachancea dasiensis]|uniref:LADA_0H20252g1_1 n=1 Tax=Lachancea dasiensis TaxID=1072105 RepID=A0A1G4K6P7_9SACH|nr:LADA_0H20252g1_1 [Lachancea dasiensis]